MKKRLPIIIGVIIVLVISLWYGFTDRTHKIYDNNVNTAQYTALSIPLEGESITQSFICEEDVLDGFYIKCNPSGSYEDVVVTVDVIDTASGEIIASTSEIGSSFKARKLHKFTIEPVEGYKDCTLTLVITETGTTESDGITIYYQPTDTSIGTFTVNQKAVSGVLVMKSYTECLDAATFIIVFISIMFIWGFMWFLYRLFK